MNRRRALAVTGGGLATLAGLAAGGLASTGWVADQEVPSPKGPARGRSDAGVSTRSVEDDGDVEYLAEADEVRYVTGYSGTDREPVYATRSFVEWARSRCTLAAATAAADRVKREIDAERVRGGGTSAVEGRDAAAVVTTWATLGRGGDLLQKQEVGFEALLRATPRSVAVTYVLEGRSHGATVPVYAAFEVRRNL